MQIRDMKKNALYYADEVVTYRELIQRSLQFSGWFEGRKDLRIGICMENRPEWYYGFLGAWSANVCVIAIDYLSSPEEIAYIFGDAVPSVVLASNESAEAVSKAISLANAEEQGQIMFFNVDTPPDLPVVTHVPEALEYEETDETAIMIYTSGTTGRPKGVCLSKKNIAANLVGISNLGIFFPTDVYGAILPFHHIYPLTGTVILPLVIGSTVTIITKLASEVIIEAFNRHGVTILFGIPRLYSLFHKAIMDKINGNIATKMIFNVAKSIPSMGFRKMIFGSVHRRFGGRVKYFLCGGSKVDDQVMEDFGVLGFNFVEGYGLSETSPLNTANNSPGVFKKATVGKALCNVEIKIDGGEICVRGDHVMKGYHNKPEETAEVLKDGWFYTGDAGSMDKKGFVTITGRKRELIVLASGKKVNPEEIEASIKAVNPNMIKEIGIFAKETGLFALIHPDFDFMKDNNQVNVFETIRWQVIDKYNRTSRDFRKVLNFKVMSNELPKTRIGKLKRFMFSDLAEVEEVEIEHIPDPEDESYELLKNKLSALTGVRVYADSVLELDLGLDSLAKIELESCIESTYGVSLAVTEIHGSAKVIELFQVIVERRTHLNEKGEASWSKILQSAKTVKMRGSRFILSAINFCFYWFLKLYFRFRIVGKKSLPRRPVIYASNHQSFLDAVFLYASLPWHAKRSSFFTGNKKHFRSWFTRLVAFNSRVVLVDINNNLKDTLQRIAGLIKSGHSVIIFPEGARSRDGTLMGFKKLFAILAKELQVPIVPVAIKGAYESMPIDSKIPRPTRVQVKFHDAIIPTEDLDYDALVAQTEEAIQATLLKG